MKVSIPARDLWRIAYRTVLRQRKRSLVALLTIAFGISSLLVFEGFNRGALWTYQERVVHSRMGHLQVSKRVDEGVMSTDLAERLFSIERDLETKWKDDSRITGVFPRIKLNGLLTNDTRTVPIIAEGVVPELENKFFTEIDYLSGGPLVSGSQGVILGKGVADALGVRVGDRVTFLAYTLRGSLNAVDLEVTGTFSGGVQDFDESYIRLPLDQAQKLLQTDQISAISIGLRKSGDWPRVLDDLQAALPQNLEIKSFIALDAVYYGNAVRWLRSQFFFIRLVVLAIVILGILNTVNMTIHERTSEIGTMRAMGFGRRYVENQLLREHAILGVVGSLLGVFLAFGVDKLILFNGFPMPPSPGATQGLNVHLRIDAYLIVLNVLLGVLSSLIATYWPARRASRLPIVEALGHKI